jgi:hypothetical protein
VSRGYKILTVVLSLAATAITGAIMFGKLKE